jgi:mgtE-like transporter
MKLFDKDFEEIFYSQILSLLGGIVGGTLLAIYTNQLLMLPGMLILLPGFLEMRGNISGSFASRLSSGLFLGVINPKKYNTRIIRGNFIASFLLVILVTLALGIVAFAFSFFIFGIYAIKIIPMALLAGLLANLIEIPLTLYMTFYLFRKGHDPNNIMGTIITTTGDVISIISLLITMVLV